jgi:hypothetical protein
MNEAEPEDSTPPDQLHTDQRKTRSGKTTRRKDQGAPRRFDDGPLLEIAAEYMAWPEKRGATTVDRALRNAVMHIAGSDKWAPSRVKSTIERLRKKYREQGPELEAASKNRKTPLPPFTHRGRTYYHYYRGPQLPGDLSFGPEAPDVAQLRSHSTNLLNALGRAKGWISFLEKKLSEQLQIRPDAINPELPKHITELIRVIEGEHERLGISWKDLCECSTGPIPDGTLLAPGG